ncbi:MAG: diguanylate cyclase [Candidatus Acidiferrales bacterium]
MLKLGRQGAESRTDTSEGNFQILVVDDSPVSRKVFEHALAGNYALLFAKSGAEALELFTKYQPSLVITDWMMPDLSGIELCERIRGSSKKPYTYIILVTGMSEKGSVVEGLAAGANDYVKKPFNPEELVARVGVGRKIIDLQRQIEAKNRQLEELAGTDPLTGLANRRTIKDWASRQVRSASRHGFPIWVIVADLDYFKRVNDSYGHDAGDTVLKSLAEILKGCTRASDICGRLGGEEFILVLTHVAKENIEMTVERVREQFEAKKFGFRGETVTVTASFGVAGFHGRELMDFSRMMTEADRALYEAKRAGRNRAKIVML